MSLDQVPANPLVPFVVSGDLLDPDTSDKIGFGQSTCMITTVRPLANPPSLAADCHSVYQLTDRGELHLSSGRTYTARPDGLRFTESPLAIVGGTGEFRTARGDGTAQLEGAGTTTPVRYVVELRVTTD